MSLYIPRRTDYNADVASKQRYYEGVKFYHIQQTNSKMLQSEQRVANSHKVRANFLNDTYNHEQDAVMLDRQCDLRGTVVRNRLNKEEMEVIASTNGQHELRVAKFNGDQQSVADTIEAELRAAKARNMSEEADRETRIARVMTIEQKEEASKWDQYRQVRHFASDKKSLSDTLTSIKRDDRSRQTALERRLRQGVETNDCALDNRLRLTHANDRLQFIDKRATKRAVDTKHAASLRQVQITSARAFDVKLGRHSY